MKWTVHKMEECTGSLQEGCEWSMFLELSEQRSFPINIHFFIVSAGNPSIAYDVAINPEFYKKTENSKLFLSFLLTVVMEGLKDKYSLSLQTDGKEGYNFNYVGSVSLPGSLMVSVSCLLYWMTCQWMNHLRHCIYIGQGSMLIWIC